MKLTITTLTGDKFDVEVKAEDKVKDIKVSNKGQVIKEIEKCSRHLCFVKTCLKLFWRGSCTAEVEFQFSSFILPKATADFHSGGGHPTFLLLVYK